jgi:reactive intermediate/imine deaminase
MFRLFVPLACALALAGAEIQVIAPPGATVVGPYSPGLLTSDCLYVSGQGALNAEGKIAGNVEQQLRDTLTNIRAIVEAAGLTMEHVVSTQLYLTDMSAYPRVDAVWREFFVKNPPARQVMGVHRMPVSTPVEVTAVAVRDLARKKIVTLPGEPRGASVSAAVFAGERLYISGCFGHDSRTGVVPPDAGTEVRLALDRMARTLKAAGLDFRHVVLASPYSTRAIPAGELDRAYLRRIDTANPPARTAITVDRLPGGANVEFSGVAVRDLTRRKTVRPRNMPPDATASPCVWAGDTLYCSVMPGFIPGPRSGIYAASIGHQVRQTMRNLLDGLEEEGLNFSNVVATNVYLDNIDEFSMMNRVYGQYFTLLKPTRTTVQPLPGVERSPDAEDRWPKLEEVSLVAVK